VEPHWPDFSPTSRTLAFVLDGSQTGREPDRDSYVALSAWREPLPFRIPPSPSGRTWRRVVDTALASPQDIVPEGDGPRIPADALYAVAPYSLIVLISEV
jgi:glycogen operon protein